MEILMDYEQALQVESLSITGRDIGVFVKPNLSAGIDQAFKQFSIDIEDGEIVIRDEYSPLMMTTDGQTKVGYRTYSTNPFEPNGAEAEDIPEDEDVQKFLLKVFYRMMFRKHNFGGPFPYTELLQDMVIVEREVLPIGDAIIGETFITG